MAEPVYRTAVVDAAVELPGLAITDESATGKWRVWNDIAGVPIGRWAAHDAAQVLCVAPGEWMVLGERPTDVESVDITHVRSAIRVSGERAAWALSHVCALDLSDAMMPNGAAARTKVAGAVTEVLRDDRDGVSSYLLLMSRSFARSVHARLIASAAASSALQSDRVASGPGSGG